jgi:hypothetical protein
MEACQSGRMGLTANELSPSKGTGGSNPLASATPVVIASAAKPGAAGHHTTRGDRERGEAGRSESPHRTR